MSVYCPVCGETSQKQVIEYIGPGNIEWRCPLCRTVFDVLIEFFPRERYTNETTET